jgi:hypothetical protein
MCRRHSVLHPRDVELPLLEVDLVPAHRDQLTDSETVAIDEKDQRRIRCRILTPDRPAAQKTLAHAVEISTGDAPHFMIVEQEG